jgi:hypothetical protein
VRLSSPTVSRVRQNSLPEILPREKLFLRKQLRRLLSRLPRVMMERRSETNI